jgi:hypothetical protein
VPRLTPTQRSRRAQAAATRRWDKADQAERTANGRRGQAGLLAKLERQVDPYGTLPRAELAKRVESLRSTHMARIRSQRGRKRGEAA